MSFLAFRWKLRDKILLLFILVAFVPFSVINFYLYTHAQETVKKNVEQSLATTTAQESETINNFFNFKLLGMISHSQGAALLSNDEKLIQDDLLNFMLQDADIISLTYVRPDGQELVKVDRNKIYPKTALINRKNSDEFRIAAFKFGREYISPVTFNSQGEAEITISTPIFYPKYSSSFQTLSSAQRIPQTADAIFGVLIERVSLKSLQNSIATTNIGKTGYMYLVDNEGRIIAHKNKSLQGTSQVQV